MRHPSDEQLYDLARKIAAEEKLTAEEVAIMRHTAACDDCYHMICCLLAMQDTAQHISHYASEASPAAFQVPLRDRVSSAVESAADAVKSALNQARASAGTGSASMTLAHVRSVGKRPGETAKRVKVVSGGRTFAKYDPAKQRLLIQIDGANRKEAPRAIIRLSNGEERPVRFEMYGDLYRAEVTGLTDGDYELILDGNTGL